MIHQQNSHRSSSSSLEDYSVFSNPLRVITQYSVREPVRVLVMAMVLAGCGIYMAVYHLGFKSSRNDLINPKSQFNQLWKEYLQDFGDGGNEVIVVVQGKTAEDVVPVLEELSAAISARSDFFQGVLSGIDISKVREKALHYVPIHDLHTIAGFVLQSQTILQNNWEPIKAVHIIHDLNTRLNLCHEEVAEYRRNGRSPRGEMVAALHSLHREIELLSVSMQHFFATRPNYESPWPQTIRFPQLPEIVAAASQHGTEYFIFPIRDTSSESTINHSIRTHSEETKGMMGLVLLRLVVTDAAKLAYGTEAITELRSLIAAIQQKYPNVKVGLTGMIVMENDEMRISSTASLQASILSFLGVAALFIAGFGGLRHPLPAIFALAVGFAWTVGYITLAVGHLNILSVSFGVILIGLGIDFGIHYTARYIELRSTIRNPSEAIVQTATSIGPGVVTGALTTAVAFYMAAFTEFVGIAELGIITGGGIILCCAAAMILMPAMFQLIDGGRPLRHVERPLDVAAWFHPLHAHPKTLLVFFAAATLLLAAGLPNVRYDHNLMNMQPDGLESVELEKTLLEQGGDNVWFALSITNSREELLARKEEIARRYPNLRVRELVSLIPEPDESRASLIEQIAGSLANLPERPPALVAAGAEVLGAVIASLQTLLEKDILLDYDLDKSLRSTSVSQIRATLRRCSEIRASLRTMTNEECQRRIMEYQFALAGDLLTRLHTLAAVSNPIPPEWNDLPQPLVDQFVGKNGAFLMRIYSNADIWNTNELANFVKEVRTIDPKATGIPIVTYEASLQMQRGFQWAAIYALVAITVLLWIDFNSMRITLFALLPMGFGVLQMLGIMGLFDIPLNPANMIVLPLILGIGIDDGVHVLHDYLRHEVHRQDTHGDGSGSGGVIKYELSRSTALSVLMTTLTTTIGFGSLMIASHNGLQSLGRVLVIGVSCCFFSSVVLLPAILNITHVVLLRLRKNRR